MSSSTPTPWAVRCTGYIFDKPCNGGKEVFLTREEYDYQMNRPNRTWMCPKCGGHAWWDDENYERQFNEGGDDGTQKPDEGSND